MNTLIILLALSAAPATPTQDASGGAPLDVAKTVVDSIPSEPASSWRRKLWEGYYTAAVNRRYYNQAAIDAEQAASSARWWGNAFSILGFAIPLTCWSVASRKTMAKKWVTVPLALFGLVAFGVGQIKATSAPVGLDVLYQFVASQWTDLESEWTIAMADRDSMSAEEMKETFTQLSEKQKAIETREPLHLIDHELMKSVKATSNKSLGNKIKRPS